MLTQFNLTEGVFPISSVEPQAMPLASLGNAYRLVPKSRHSLNYLCHLDLLLNIKRVVCQQYLDVCSTSLSNKLAWMVTYPLNLH